MRKLISFGLLFLFLWQIGGYLIEFQLESTRIRKEIKKLTKEAVPKNQLVYFQFSEKEIQNFIWTKKNEFKKDGHFFDVVWKKKIATGVVEFQCVSDDQETVLFAKLDQYVSANLVNSNPDKTIKNWSKLFFGNYISTETFPKPILIKSFSKKLTNNFIYQSSISERHLFIETPPPNVAFS